MKSILICYVINFIQELGLELYLFCIYIKKKTVKSGLLEESERFKNCGKKKTVTFTLFNLAKQDLQKKKNAVFISFIEEIISSAIR